MKTKTETNKQSHGQQAIAKARGFLAEAKPKDGSSKLTVKKAVPKAPANKRTVANVATDLIIAGKTNEEIVEALRKEFKGLELDAGGKHHHYVGWYRARAVREKLVTAAFASQHRHAPAKVEKLGKESSRG
jgi:hypothetical protein